jgi:hypothetical protein
MSQNTLVTKIANSATNNALQAQNNFNSTSGLVNTLTAPYTLTTTTPYTLGGGWYQQPSYIDSAKIKVYSADNGFIVIKDGKTFVVTDKTELLKYF